MLVSVRKYGDNVVVQPKEGESEDQLIERMVSVHGASGVLVDGVPYNEIAAVTDEQPAAEPSVDEVKIDEAAGDETVATDESTDVGAE